MEEIISAFSSPYWWMSVVVVSVVTNMLSAYLKNLFDSCFSKAFSWWRNRSVERKAEWRKKLDWIKQSERNLLIQSFEENRHRLRTIHFLLLACLTGVLTSFVSQMSHGGVKYLEIFGLAMSAFCVICSTYAFFWATYEHERLKQAIKEDI